MSPIKGNNKMTVKLLKPKTKKYLEGSQRKKASYLWRNEDKS